MRTEERKVPELRFKGFMDDWEQRKFKEILKVNSGRDYKHLSFGDIPVFGTGGYMLSVNDKLSSQDAIGIGRKGTINKPQFLKAPFWTVDTLFFVTSNKLTDIQFLYFLFQKINWLKFDESTGVPSLSKNTIEGIITKLPIEKEQSKIGNMLTIFDYIVDLHQRKTQILGVLYNIFTNKLYPHSYNNEPTLRFPCFTNSWVKIQLDQILEEFSHKSKIENEHQVLSSTNSGMEFRKGRVSGTSNRGYKIISNGDLVISPQNLWLGNININNLGRGLVSPSYKTFKISELNGRFIEPQLRTKRMLKNFEDVSTQGASIVRRNLDLDLFNQLTIKMPSNEEKQAIVKILDSLKSIIDAYEERLNELKKLKSSYLQKMFL